MVTLMIIGKKILKRREPSGQLHEGRIDYPVNKPKQMNKFAIKTKVQTRFIHQINLPYPVHKSCPSYSFDSELMRWIKCIHRISYPGFVQPTPQDQIL